MLVEMFQSIRLSQLEVIIENVCCELEEEGPAPMGGHTSEDLKQYLIRNRMHLLERFHDRFSVDTPDVVVTYMWLATPLRRLPPLLRRIEPVAGHDPLLWLDVIFNDQRSPQAIARAVANADKLYIRARIHVMIYSTTEYPAFDSSGAQKPEPVMCAPWDRCWCVLEMALRHLAVKRQEKQQTVMLMLEENQAKLVVDIQSPAAADGWIRKQFKGRDFYGGMQGRPDDVREIQATLLSPGFFSTPSAFNEHMESTLCDLFGKSIGEIMPDAREEVQAHAAEMERVKAAAREEVQAAELERMRVAVELERFRAESKSYCCRLS